MGLIRPGEGLDGGLDVTSAAERERRLLIVDDDREIGDLIARVATGAGYSATVVTNPAAFMAEFDRLSPSVVSIDMLMPEMDGLELVDWVVQRRLDVKILIVSGSDPLYAEIADLRAKARGAQEIEFMPKPLDVAALQQALASK